MSELKPCPFCGSKPIENKWHSFQYYCSNENCNAYHHLWFEEDWNTRTDPVKDQMLEALKEAQDKFDFLQDSFPKTLNKIDHAINAAEKEES